MPRTTTDPRSMVVRARVTQSEYQRLRKCAEVLNTTMSAILMRGLALVEAQVQATEKAADSRK